MKTLQNKLKTASEPVLTSGNGNLKQLFCSNRQSIQATLDRQDFENRIVWINLNALMVDFKKPYFAKTRTIVKFALPNAPVAKSCVPE